MVLAEVEARRNGTTGAVSFAIKTVTLDLGEIGYPGCLVTMRINPRRSVYDELLSGDVARWWKAFGQIVLEWNFADEDGKVLPHPRDAESEEALDLPIGLLNFVVERYHAAVTAAAAVPKAPPSVTSVPSSSTSESAPEQ